MNIEEAGHANALETPPSRFLSRRFESGHALQSPLKATISEGFDCSLQQKLRFSAVF